MFALRFQQLSAPVMAKGMEDTAFYRYYPLASLNEVGGSPERFGLSIPAFHRRNLVRGDVWPNSMNASSTHDTKRGEDVRARINVLSEMPSDWYRGIRRWRDINRHWKTKVGELTAPDSNEEYLLYQTLVGTWPLLPMNPQEHADYIQRLQAYMEKAVHEAKVHSSWVSPNAAYDQAVRDFVAKLLQPSTDNTFLEDFRQFQAPIAQAGMWNSLSQVVLKMASPGVPDFYQGNELWSFHLVDPDNRGPVDFDRRQKMLAKLREKEDIDPGALMDRLVRSPCDGAIKLFVTHRALSFRRNHRQLFTAGSYVPLTASGSRSNHVVAFARQSSGGIMIALAGRFFLRLRNSHPAPIGDLWGNTAILLPKKIKHGSFQDVFTGQNLTVQEHEGESYLQLSQVFSRCPVALLFSENPN
jgi:(1->4)-alpha-D-glucan 1-alpha-D-glucosylmutase